MSYAEYLGRENPRCAECDRIMPEYAKGDPVICPECADPSAPMNSTILTYNSVARIYEATVCYNGYTSSKVIPRRFYETQRMHCTRAQRWADDEIRAISDRQTARLWELYAR